jgi:hypothetical protein
LRHVVASPSACRSCHRSESRRRDEGHRRPRSNANAACSGVTRGRTPCLSAPSKLAFGMGCGSAGPHHPVQLGRRGPHDSYPVGYFGTMQVGHEQICSPSAKFYWFDGLLLNVYSELLQDFKTYHQTVKEGYQVMSGAKIVMKLFKHRRNCKPHRQC